MKSRFKFSIILLVVVLVLSALMQATQKKKIDWNKTYNPLLTKPYDTYVLKQELPNLFHKKPTVTTVNKSLYLFLEEKENYNPNDALLCIGTRFDIGEAGTKKLFNFVKNGGTVFMSIPQFHYTAHIFDSLGLDYENYSAYETNNGITEYSTQLSVAKYNQKATFDKLETPRLFSELPKDSSNITILGTMHVNETVAPNFVRVTYGKGTFFIHLEPDVFTNYYLLQKETFPIAIHALSYLEGKNILWYDGLYNTDQQQTPLRFILSNQALSAAWYLLLVALIFYLIFKSKREQRAIPVIEPEANKSVEFAKTIGSLYYENGSSGSMAQKKIQYFLNDLRRNFHLDTNNLSDKKFVHSLSQRTSIPEQEVREFLSQLSLYHKNENCSIHELKALYTLIEEFKEKANM
ncbi:MAG TPA: hypothetical protein PLP27_11195 [Crocinitomicaceae bacterium]|nr:hypothetical protein [Crocinitomicaceae bacterium]